MTSSPDRPLRSAEIHAKRELSRHQLILMMAIAASKAAVTPVIPKTTCKPRANCLKPKEIAF
jgi:hypothetical protein